MHFHQMQSRELNPVKKDGIQLLIQDSYSEVIGKVAGRRFDLGSQCPSPTGSNEFEVCVSDGKVRRPAVDYCVVKRKRHLPARDLFASATYVETEVGCATLRVSVKRPFPSLGQPHGEAFSIWGVNVKTCPV